MQLTKSPGPPTGPARGFRSGHRAVVVGVVLVVVVVVVMVVVVLDRHPVIGDEYDGAGPGTLAPDGSSDTRPTVGWVDPGDRFFVRTYGSSSCPAAPTGLEQHGATVDVEMRQQGGPACTLDLGPNTYAVDLPVPRDPASGVDVTLHFEDGTTTQLRLVG